MNQTMKVSVIIPNYNYAAFVGQAIESVFAQTYQNYEVIVVNNGSTDNSLEVLSKYADKIILVDQANLGQSGARNTGIQNSTGDLLAFLDADDFWEPEKLEKQVGLVSETCQLIYCGIKHYLHNAGGKPVEQQPQYKGDCRELFQQLPGVGIVLGGESTVLITRGLLNKVGGFDIRLSSSSGWDFYRRCSNHTHFDYVSEPLSNYRIHDNNMSKNTATNVQDIRRSFLIMAQSMNSKPKTFALVQGFLNLELSFIKTYIREKRFFSLILEVAVLPLRFANLYLLWLRKDHL
jgi:glycosyltransferase involved in cell wall biosynthesis